MKKQTVEACLSKLNHPQTALINTIRQTIQAAAPELTEGVKWNAPSYALNGNDIITFNFRQAEAIALIFHTGPKGKDTQTGQRLFEETPPQLKWLADKRCLFSIQDPADWKASEQALRQLVQTWLRFAQAQFEPDAESSASR